MDKKTKIIFSGMQPTSGDSAMHLGNYLGAMQQWLQFQAEGTCYFCIVDLHAITLPQDPAILQKSIYNMAAQYIACGIDTDRSIIYQQSKLPQHAQLAWVLGCMAPLGWLKRMTQFKDKSKKQQETNLGLLSYPVLMAADILLFNTTHVPVGDDQKQHLELTRDIAGLFNNHYQCDHFILPEPIIKAATTRVMSLRSGTNKMSKSDESDYSRVNLSDDDDLIVLKIRKAKTDPDLIGANMKEMQERPEATNLINIMAAVTKCNPDEVCAQYVGQNFATFKADLADALITLITPIRAETKRLLKHKDILEQYLATGTQKAIVKAEDKWQQTKSIMGLA